MRALDIALKDLTQSFRSLFALAMMFGVPILVTLMFVLMFGGFGDGDEGIELPQIAVVVTNLDEPGVGMQGALGEFSSIGEMLVEILQADAFAELLAVTVIEDADEARAVVDNQGAGVAILIPPNLTASMFDPQGEATIELYQDPTLTLGPSIVQGIIRQFVDGFAGTKIAVQVINEQLHEAGLESGAAKMQQVAMQYVELSGDGWEGKNAMQVLSPAGQEASGNQAQGTVSLIMGGMTIFYAFFAGTASAQTILTEEEKGTLPRLFTTPTPLSTILSGKFLAVGLTVIVQMTVLLLFGYLVFRIRWGNLLAVASVVLGTVAAASAFGIFVMSFVQDSKQAGILYGTVVTMAGMLGMITIFTMGIPNSPQLIDTFSLLVPQGWAVRGLRLAMDGNGVGEVGLVALVLLVWAVVFFLIGNARFRKRFA